MTHPIVTRARVALLAVTATAAAAVGISTASGSANCSSTPLAPSCFEAHDGDLAAAAGRLDWGNLEATESSDPSVPFEVTLPDATVTNDDVFKGGEKENDLPSTWDIQNQSASTKGDFRRGVFARDVVGGDVFFYAGFERVGTTGTDNMSVELNQKPPVMSSGRLVPDRSADDLLIVFDGQLSGVATIGFCKWKDSPAGWYRLDGDGNATNVMLSGSDKCISIAELNKPTVAAGRVGAGALANPGLLAGFSNPIPAGTFAEVGVNLSELLTGGATTARCFSYGAVFMHSRASDAGDASMEDYVAPKAIPATGTCAIDVEKTVSTSAAGPFTQSASATPGDTLHYRLTATNAGTVTLDAPAPTDTGSWDPDGPGATAPTSVTGCSTPTLATRLKSDGSADTDGTFDPGDRWTWTCTRDTATFAEGGSYTNTLVVDGDAPGPGGSTIPVTSEQAQAVVTFPPANRSMSVVKKVATSAAGPFGASVSGASPLSALHYRIEVANTGTVALNNIQLTDTGLSDPDAGGPNAGTTRNPGCAGLDAGPNAALSTGEENGTLDAGETWVWTCSQSPAAGGFAYSGTYSNAAFASANPVGGGVAVVSTPGSATTTFGAKPAGGGNNNGGGGAGAGSGSASSSGGQTGTSTPSLNLPGAEAKFATAPSKQCLTKKYRLDVVGGSIVRVTFLVDGKVRKVLTRPGATGRWSFDVNPSLKDTKRHRVQVRIEYTPSSGRKTKVLSHVYQRCACASRRNFRIRVKSKRKDPVVRATVHVNGKRVKVLRGKRLTAPVKLTGLPKGRFTVKVVATTRSGKRQVDERQYRTCTKKRAAKKRR